MLELLPVLASVVGFGVIALIMVVTMPLLKSAVTVIGSAESRQRSAQ